MLGRVASHFAETYPADAAHVLEQTDALRAGQVLAALPAATGSALLQAMTPQAAAACLAGLPPASAAALIARCPTGPATPLLLCLDATARSALLRELPAKTATALRLALRFPAGSVGALIDPDVVTVRADMRIGEAVEIARRAPAALRKYLYVLDDSQHLAGVLDARQCVLQDAGRPISAVRHVELVALRARTGMHQARLLDAWDRFDVLPATDRHGVFLGVVRRESLFRAVSAQSAPTTPGNLAKLTFDLAELFWGTTSRLVLGEPGGARRH